MSTALVPMKELDADQIALVKRTVAVGASDDELKLFFFDCQRRGVHPLDKLIYFTKRKGKYTPITSIDFFRTRAHDTGKCAGITDPAFEGEARKPGFSATVTVRRLVDMHVAEFTATARWDEYKPDENDFMWRKMPFTMLGKCAEALALRKAFPHELAGLYTGDEMAQAGKSETAVEHVNTTTGEIFIASGGEGFVAPKPTDAEAIYTGILSGKPSRKSGSKLIFEFDVDGQTMNTLDLALAEQAIALNGERVTVMYTRTAKGGLMLTSVAAAPKASSEAAEPEWSQP